MEELIKIKERDGKQAVSARELYAFLGLEERFSKWFNRFADYGFVESEDYTPYQMVHPQNNQDITDYAITIDMAKELSMLQRTEKGKQARRYFIACEEKLRLVPQTEEEILLLAMTTLSKRVEAQKKQLEIAETTIEEQKPKVAFYDITANTNKLYSIGEAAKTLNFKGVGRNILYQLLKEKKVIMENNEPYQNYVDSGSFKLLMKYNESRGDTYSVTMVTQKGMRMMVQFLEKLGYQQNKID